MTAEATTAGAGRTARAITTAQPSAGAGGLRLFVEAWDPAYGAGVESAEFVGGSDSTAQLGADVEVPASAWRPMMPDGTVRAPDVVLLIDGVRRVDARLWIGDETEVSPGLAASFAAGVVRCDLRRGAAEVVPTARVARGVFSPCKTAVEVVTSAARYPVFQAKTGDLPVLSAAVQTQLQALESAVCAASRDESTSDELLVADGPLRGRAGVSRMLGYIKSHEKTYLPPTLSRVVAALRAGQRSPVFLLGTRWSQYTWYLRLPGPTGAPWGNLVRVECSAELSISEAIRLADVSTVTLPRFASTAYKDPRAPQNLMPIAGLERRLRGMLGDSRLLHRALTTAARSPARPPATPAAADGS